MTITNRIKPVYLKMVMLTLFLLLMAAGIYFKEYLYLLNYGSIICLSCIGIG